MQVRYDPVTVIGSFGIKNVTGPCDFKVGPGRRFRSDELKSGELLAIGIGMILTVDRKHNFFMSFCVRI